MRTVPGNPTTLGRRAAVWLAACAVAAASVAAATEVRIERRLGDAAAASRSAWVGVFDDPVAPGAVARRWMSFDGRGFGFRLPAERLPATLVVLVPECARPALHRIEASAEDARIVVGAPCGPELVGVVRLDYDHALPYVQVTIAEASGSGPALPEHVRARWRATEEGVVTIPGVPPGRYEVSAISHWHLPQTVSIDVADGGRRFVLEMVPTGKRVVGRVVDLGGHGIVGARVVATSHTSAVEGVTGARGFFVLGPVVGSTESQLVVASHGRATSLPHYVPSPTPRLEVVLGGVARIRGVVSAWSTGAPVDDFEVTVHVGKPPVREVFRDGSGRFAIDFPGPEKFAALEVRASGYTPSVAYLYSLPPGETVFVAMTMEPGRVVSGRVVAAAGGLPVAGALVEASGTVAYGSLVGRTATTTDAAGRFELRMWKRSSLRVSAPGYAPVVIAEPGDSDQALTINLPGGREIVGDMVLPDGMPTAGSVSLGPLPVTHDESYDFWEMREAMNNELSTTVEADGRFRFRDLAARRYVLSGESPDGTVARRTIEVYEHAATPPLRVVVEPPARVTGTVTGLDPGEGATLSVRRRTSWHEVAWDAVWDLTEVASTRSIADGPFEFVDLPDGHYVLTAWSTTERQVLVPFVVAGRADVRLPVAFGRSRLAGRVLHDGQGMRGVDVVVWHGGTMRQAGSNYTGEDGRFAIGGLQDGSYEVVARGNRLPVEIRGDTELDLPLTLRSLSGTVRVDGSVGGRWYVRASRLDLPGADGRPVWVQNARLGESGEYRIDGLAPGRYQIVYSNPWLDRVVRRVHLNASVTGFDFDARSNDDVRQVQVAPLPRSHRQELHVSVESGDFDHASLELSLDEHGTALLPASLRGADLGFRLDGEIGTIDIPAWDGEALYLEFGDE